MTPAMANAEAPLIVIFALEVSSRLSKSRRALTEPCSVEQFLRGCHRGSPSPLPSYVRAATGSGKIFRPKVSR